MSMARVNCFAVSLDGYGAGPQQDFANPLGVGGTALHQWFYPTHSFQGMFGKDDGTIGTDDEYVWRAIATLGAWIIDRNMFGPIRGEWPEDAWKGRWGENPPYHVPLFVLTHYPRRSVEMPGGTTFHFVTEGIEEALRQAREAAGTREIRIGGGVQTIRQYLQAGLVYEMHLVVPPFILGSGEHLLSGLNLAALGFRVSEHDSSQAAMHVVLRRGALV